MAYTTMLIDGPNVLTQNTVYAMPGKTKFVYAEAALAVAVTNGGTFVLVTATTTTGALIPGGSFVKCTTGTTNVTVTNQ